MFIEQRVENLEKENQELKDRLAFLESRGTDRFVTPKELAEIMHCSRNNVLLKIRSGEIYATRLVGDPRIPLSQFYNRKEEPAEQQDKKKNTGKSMAALVFG